MQIKQSGTKTTVKIYIPQSPPFVRIHATPGGNGNDPRHIHVNITNVLKHIINGRG